MKKVLVALSLLAPLFAHSALGQSVSDSASVQNAFSAEEAAQMRQAVQSLNALFGLNQQSQTPQPAQVVPQKNMAEVADKALDLTARGVSYIAQNLEKAAPWVWKVMIRQQYAKAIADLVVPWELFTLTIIYTVIVRKKLVHKDEDNNEAKNVKIAFRSVVPLFFGLCFGWWGIDNIADSVKYLINPNYYAIQDLLRMILQPGSGM